MSLPRVREAQEKLGGTIAADPAKAQAKNAPATARLAGGLRSEVTGPRGEKLVTDMPVAVGGEGSAPNPGWVFRGAVASCAVSVIAMRAAKVGIELSTLEVTVESDSDLRGILGLDDSVPAGQTAVRMKVRIGAPGASPESLRELVAWADAHSPVGCTLKQQPAYSVTTEIV